MASCWWRWQRLGNLGTTGIWWTNISLDLAGTFAALCFLTFVKGYEYICFGCRTSLKLWNFLKWLFLCSIAGFEASSGTARTRINLPVISCKKKQYFYMLLADYWELSPGMCMLCESVGILLFNLKRPIHMRTFEKTVFNATGGRKSLYNHSHCSDTVCSIIQLLVLVIKFLVFCVHPIKTVTAKMRFILQLVFLRANLNDSLFIRKWLQGRSLLTMH